MSKNSRPWETQPRDKKGRFASKTNAVTTELKRNGDLKMSEVDHAEAVAPAAEAVAPAAETVKVKLKDAVEFHPKLREAKDSLKAVEAGEALFPAELEELQKALADANSELGKSAKPEIKEQVKAAHAELGKTIEAATKERSFAAKMLLNHKSRAGQVIKDMTHAEELGGVVRNLNPFKVAGIGAGTFLGAKIASGLFSSKHPEYDAGRAR
jgi:paraquat-inducible protein B